MDLEKYARQLQQGKSGSALQKLAESKAGAQLAKSLDTAKLEDAARRGDTQTLSDMLKSILATPEGRSFAAQVEKAVETNGR